MGLRKTTRGCILVLLCTVALAFVGFSGSPQSTQPAAEPASVGTVEDLEASATGQDPGSVLLTWTAAENAQVHFVVYIESVDLANGEYGEARMVPFAGSEGMITGLEGGTSYSFIVTGMRWNWVEYGRVWGSWSTWVSATPEGQPSRAGSSSSASSATEPTTVGTVENLETSTTGLDAGSVRLTWTAAENAQVHFVVYIKSDDLANGNFGDARMAPFAGLEGVITGLAGDTSYSFIAIGMRWNWVEYGRVWGSWSAWISATPSGEEMVSPSAAFGELVIGKRFDAETFYVDFGQDGRFIESGQYAGSYTYVPAGSNTGTLTLNYDGEVYGGSCTVSLVFDSNTTGTWNYTCASGISGEGSWSVAERGVEFIEGESTTRFIHENITADINVGLPILAAGNASAYAMSGTDAESFSVNPETGQIRTKSGVVYDYEGKNKYSVNVGVTDDRGNNDSIQVTIRLQDVASGCGELDNLRANHSDGRLTVRWNPMPDRYGAAGVLGYQTEKRRGDDGSWTDQRTHLGPGISAMIYHGLENGAEYQIRARTVDIEGKCEWSLPALGTPTDVLTPRYPTDRFGTRIVGVPGRNWRFLTEERCRYADGDVTLDANCLYENTGEDTGTISLVFDDPSLGSCTISIIYSTLTTGSFSDDCFEHAVDVLTEFDVGFKMPDLASGAVAGPQPSASGSAQRVAAKHYESSATVLFHNDGVVARDIDYEIQPPIHAMRNRPNPSPLMQLQRAPRSQAEFDALVYGRDGFIPGLCFGKCFGGNPPKSGTARRMAYDLQRRRPVEYIGTYKYETVSHTKGKLTYTETSGETWVFNMDFEPTGVVGISVTDLEGKNKKWHEGTFDRPGSLDRLLYVPLPYDAWLLTVDEDQTAPKDAAGMARRLRKGDHSLANVSNNDIIKIFLKERLAQYLGQTIAESRISDDATLGQQLADVILDVDQDDLPVSVEYQPIGDGRRMQFTVQFGDYSNDTDLWSLLSSIGEFFANKLYEDAAQSQASARTKLIIGALKAIGTLTDEENIKRVKQFILSEFSNTAMQVDCDITSRPSVYDCATSVVKDGEPPTSKAEVIDTYDAAAGNIDRLPDELFLPDTPPQAGGQDQSGVQVAAAVSAEEISGSDVQTFLVSDPGDQQQSFQPGDWLEPKDGSYQRMMVVGAQPVTTAVSTSQGETDNLIPAVSNGGMVSWVPISWSLDASGNSCVPRVAAQNGNAITRLDVVCMQLDREIPTRGARYFSQPKTPEGPVQTCQRDCILNAGADVQECVWRCEFNPWAASTTVANDPPTIHTIANRNAVVGTSLKVEIFASDADPRDTLTYRAESSNMGVATVTVNGKVATVAPVATGTATITVTVSDGDADVSTTFVVMVAAPASGNHPPSISAIVNQQARVGVDLTVVISAADSDPGDTLTYDATSSNNAVATVSVSGNVATVTPVSAGVAAITVSASDGNATAYESFTVSVATATGTQQISPSGLESPQNVQFIWNNDQIVISWDAVQGAEHYKVYYDDFFSSGCRVGSDGSTSFCELLADNVSGTTYTHTSPDDNDNYYWVVACNSEGCSDVVSAAFVDTKPSPPTNVVGEFVGQDIRISWDAVSDADYYEVYYDDFRGSLFFADLLATNVTETTYLHTEIGDANWYWVSACNSGGCSDPVGATPAEPVPDQPDNVQYVRDGSTIRVSWNAVEEANYYRVYYDDFFSSFSFAELLVDNVSGTTYTHSNPDDDRNYYWVAACNRGGCSEFVSATFIDTRPAAPTNVQYDLEGSSIRVSWDVVSGADYYRIYYDDFFGDSCRVRSDGSGSFCELLADNVFGTSYTHTEPDDDENYYWVAACNSGGCSNIVRATSAGS